MNSTTYHRARHKAKPEYDYLAPNDKLEFSTEVRAKRVHLRRKLTQIASTLKAHGYAD